MSETYIVIVLVPTWDSFLANRRLKGDSTICSMMAAQRIVALPE
jgi:hypothetical protein